MAWPERTAVVVVVMVWLVIGGLSGEGAIAFKLGLLLAAIAWIPCRCLHFLGLGRGR